MNCEYCGKKHDGSFASGRFCNRKCSNGFSTKAKRKEINKKVSGILKNKVYVEKIVIKCPMCENKKEIRKNNKKYYKTDYCGNCIRKSDYYKNKISKSTKGKNGGYRKNSGNGKYGWYKGYWCQSSWELAYVIYNLEHNIIFKRNKEVFHYKWENKIRKYLPDFKKENEYVEIKGYKTEQFDYKIKQFPKHLKLIILYKKDMKFYLDYVENKYGKDFIKMYNNI